MSRACLWFVAIFLIPVAGLAQLPAPSRDTSAATRTATIRGRVLVNGTDHPLPRVQIRATSDKSATHDAFTDGNGRYELKGLPAGQYTVAATRQNYVRHVFGQQRFNGAGKRIAVADGQTVTQIDFTLVRAGVISDLVMGLKPTRAVRVSGTIMTSDGKPMMGMLSIMRVQGQGFMTSMATSVRPDGSFQLNAVAPGEYQLRSAFLNGAPGSDTETAFAKITVAEEDITGLQLVGAKPSLLRGRVIVDPGAAQSLPAAVVLNAFPVDGPGFSDGAGSRMADDYTFEVKAMAGRSRIALGNAPPGWSIRAVRLNGVDVIDTGVEVKPNENVRGLEVELTNRVTTVTGLATNARGEASKDYTAIAFARDSERWKDPASRYQRTGRPDQDGRFKLSGLPPGEYYLIAVDQIEPGQNGDPEFLDQIRSKATPFTLGEGETKSVNLRVASGS